MRPATMALLTLALCQLTPATALANGPSVRAQAGKLLADMVCSACHQIEPNPAFPPTLDPPAPSFQSIADRPATTLGGLKRFMAHTKWDEHSLPMSMPNLMLTSDEQDELARYILSLRAKPKS